MLKGQTSVEIKACGKMDLVARHATGHVVKIAEEQAPVQDLVQHVC